MTESTVPEITYYGLSAEDSDILRFPKFVEAVKSNGYVLVDGDGHPVTTDEVQWVTVVDPATGTELSVIIDDAITEVIKLEGFREILRAMDDFLKISLNCRLFEMSGVGSITDEDPEYDWEFDFELGGYVNPELSPEGHKMVNRKASEPQTFSEVFGMSAMEYIKRMIP
jgi:hypothetical protein